MISHDPLQWHGVCRYLKSEEDARRESLQFRNECAHNEAVRQEELKQQELQESIDDYVSSFQVVSAYYIYMCVATKMNFPCLTKFFFSSHQEVKRDDWLCMQNYQQQLRDERRKSLGMYVFV